MAGGIVRGNSANNRYWGRVVVNGSMVVSWGVASEETNVSWAYIANKSETCLNWRMAPLIFIVSAAIPDCIKVMSPLFSYK